MTSLKYPEKLKECLKRYNYIKPDSDEIPQDPLFNSSNISNFKSRPIVKRNIVENKYEGGFSLPENTVIEKIIFPKKMKKIKITRKEIVRRPKIKKSKKKEEKKAETQNDYIEYKNYYGYEDSNPFNEYDPYSDYSYNNSNQYEKSNYVNEDDFDPYGCSSYQEETPENNNCENNEDEEEYDNKEPSEEEVEIEIEEEIEVEDDDQQEESQEKFVESEICINDQYQAPEELDYEFRETFIFIHKHPLKLKENYYNNCKLCGRCIEDWTYKCCEEEYCNFLICKPCAKMAKTTPPVFESDVQKLFLIPEEANSEFICGKCKGEIYFDCIVWSIYPASGYYCTKCVYPQIQ